MCADVTRQQFVQREADGRGTPDGPQAAALRRGRETLWQTLRGASLTMGDVFYKTNTSMATMGSTGEGL